MKVGIVGCGFVADFYAETAANHPNIEIKSVYDIDEKRLVEFCQFYSLNSEESLESMLNDDEIEMIFNLTNPKNHYEISHSIKIF